MAKERAKRPDRDGNHRKVFEWNKKKIYATQHVGGGNTANSVRMIFNRHFEVNE